ncbi:universal stress protein [Acinetobacter sp. KAM398]|uniref:Universal stress protein n=1 Tax=Acinetobacter towneri TaxID=202956 RepID=A0A1E8E2K1_9GAMM|nr:MULTISPECIES: universal stress protein [Acinetobacter]MCD0187397.1 universal stress protein [Acinetobacter sp. PW68]OFE43905.1 universal stress protein [Acinetobacter towneri]GJC30690.1 universal stress protein [Acinetobacter sp. KAM392]GJC33499.1 universal stress protein [Acinetobacter sp. KAM393]GJC36294.1 universal stress protein [Acinetobacter sp. KAM394]
MAYQNILVPVDGSETSFAAVAKAAELAKAFGSKITVVQVLTLDPYIAAEYITANQTNDLIERARASIVKTLEEAKQKFTEQGVEAETKLLEGQVIAREITNAAKELNADLIVIGSHGRTGLKKLFLGSVAQSILSEGTTPVLVVRQ